ncbi:hypothetical protein P691DRAFT_668180 [Macrolepiota fuliginosa MF-IS2]|uniref:Eukaryotic translation initiation factor 2D n=1 Tax=Macrolepiota fuliginosa MF-IS2 TaxID=1400762 RepID=A0A9P6C4S1_9AGAR|nr:hypothetical protein P691DRAFT_668180 [Macrolepiota fuliginosa MF-IS2]
MFKKPLGQLKTSAPIRASDRRKLKQRVVSAFSALPEDGDLLVPDGILTAKFLTYAKEPGTVYLDPTNGNPLWFTIGKGSDDLIPSVYTLWKLNNSNLLPSILTPAAVIPILVGGADLMIPGVITHTPAKLAQNQLVAIHHLSSTKNADGNLTRVVSPPLAVGRMAVSSEDLKVKSEADEKGKAVLVLHTWKDHLWEMGQKGDVPPDVPLALGAASQAASEEGSGEDGSEGQDGVNQGEGGDEDQEDQGEHGPATEDADLTPKIAYTPQEITDLLTKSLIHTIATQLSSLTHASFPIPASQLYATYILPSRPAYPTSILLPSVVSSQSADAVDVEDIHIDPSEITIKASTHKSLTTFLKAAEKLSLLALKATKQKSGGGDVLVTGVNAQHADVVAYASGKRFVTIAEIEAKKAKRTAREEKEEEERERSAREVDVRQVWKPHLRSVAIFEDMGVSVSDVYTLTDIRTLLSNYFTSKQLINKRDPAYINLNPPLLACLSSKTTSEPKKGGKGGKTATADQGVVAENQPPLEFMKRDEMMKKVVEQMQSWYEVKVEGRDPVTSKGEIKPIQVEVRYKQGGRRGTTAITGFEPFLVIDADDMAEDLRKICAGSSSGQFELPNFITFELRLTAVCHGFLRPAVLKMMNYANLACVHMSFALPLGALPGCSCWTPG